MTIQIPVPDARPSPKALSAFFGTPIDPDIEDRILARARQRQFEALETLADAQDSCTDVFLILSGQVRVIYHTSSDRSIILDDLGPGNIVGELAAIDGMARSAIVTATSPLDVIVLPEYAFLDLAASVPGIARAVFKLLASRVRALNDRLAAHAFLETRFRLYAELLAQSRPRRSNPAERIISPPPLHRELAQRIACRREVVTRELSSMRRQNLISTERSGLVIHNPVWLEKQIEERIRN